MNGDINPTNLILDPDGKVSIIDWGRAGAHPPILEAARMSVRSRFKEFSELVLPCIEYDAEGIEHLKGVLWGIHCAACG